MSVDADNADLEEVQEFAADSIEIKEKLAVL
jgi:hypothetical protein